jgi:hypothetical protein
MGRTIVVQFLEDLGRGCFKGYNYQVDPAASVECNEELVATCQFGSKLVRVISVYSDTKELRPEPRHRLCRGGIPL